MILLVWKLKILDIINIILCVIKNIVYLFFITSLIFFLSLLFMMVARIRESLMSTKDDK